MTSDSTAEQLIRSNFLEVAVLPCWQVSQGHGSFITMDFGNPHLWTREPNPNARSSWLRRRFVAVKGEYHLWIEQCVWSIIEAGCELAHSESDREEIATALRKINGQVLLELDIEPVAGSCNLTFEHEMQVTLTRYDDWEPDEPLLHFYNYPRETVLSLLADGRLEYGPGDYSSRPSVACPALKLVLTPH